MLHISNYIAEELSRKDTLSDMYIRIFIGNNVACYNRLDIERKVAIKMKSTGSHVTRNCWMTVEV